MAIFDLISILLTLSAGFAYLNHRYIKLPTTIGLMLIAFIMSLALVLIGQFDPSIVTQARTILNQIDFNKTLLEGMLSLLLFAGALHINLNDLASQKWTIAITATIGVIASTFIIGFSLYYILILLNLKMSLIYCFLFGALISPTDPIAVLAILKKANAPKSLETKIAGESLFNDGIGVVIFIVIFSLATSHESISTVYILKLFFLEVIGGAFLGFGMGYLTFKMLKSIDNYQVEVLITLALTTGGYALAHHFQLSGPIAIVVSGLILGNHGRHFAMSDVTRKHLDLFWELIDEILNAILFVLIGLEVLVLTFEFSYFIAGLIAIPLALGARFICVGIPITLLKLKRTFSKNAIKVMTWGGLRGGISVALALSLPQGKERELILMITYMVVVFSILIQGTTVKKLIKS